MSLYTMPAVAEAELWIFMCNFLSPAVLALAALPRGKPHPPILELLRFTCLEQRGWRQNSSFCRWVMAINISTPCMDMLLIVYNLLTPVVPCSCLDFLLSSAANAEVVSFPRLNSQQGFCV